MSVIIRRKRLCTRSFCSLCRKLSFFFLYGFYAYGRLAVALAICCASCSLWVIALDWSNNTPACMTMIHQRNHECLPGSPTLVITLAGY